jgi:hypothetical protein
MTSMLFFNPAWVAFLDMLALPSYTFSDFLWTLIRRFLNHSRTICENN